MKIFGMEKDAINEQVKSGNTKISIIGFGYVGISIGVILTKTSHVTAIDVNPKILEDVNNGKSPINEPGVGELMKNAKELGRITATPNIEEVKNSDVILVTVGTPLGENYEPNFDYIKKVSEDLGPLLQKGDMVILKSTVTPGTTEGIVKETLEEKSGLKAGEDFGLAFCPERLAEGSAIKDLETLPIIIGGMNEKSSMVASTFWEALGFKTVPVSSAKTAEMTKLADNLWIDLNIALGNEMAKLSEKLGVNAVEVIEAANTLPKGQHMVNILYPGSGVGGSCLVKDPWFVHHIAKKYGLDLKIPKASREVNDSMPQHMYDMIALSLKETGKEVANSKVAILGIAFKGGTGDTRSTPAKDLIKLLETGNANILAYDPWVEREEAATVTKKMTDSLEEVLKDADCVVIETDHPEFKELDISKIKELGKENVCIIDGRNVFDSKKVKEIGLSYKGIGKGV